MSLSKFSSIDQQIREVAENRYRSSSSKEAIKKKAPKLSKDNDEKENKGLPPLTVEIDESDEYDEKLIERLAKLDPRLPKPFWSWILQGPSGSGKTALAIQIIKWYQSFHDVIIIVSRLVETDKKMMKLILQLREAGIEVKVFLRYSDAVMQYIEKFIADRAGKQNILLVLDDMTQEENVNNHSPLVGRWITQFRKLHVNILMIFHKYNAIHVLARTQSKILTTFELLPLEIKQVRDERGIDLEPYMDHMQMRKQEEEISPHSFITHTKDFKGHHVTLNMNTTLSAERYSDCSSSSSTNLN
jgi:hypothetical protein